MADENGADTPIWAIQAKLLLSEVRQEGELRDLHERKRREMLALLDALADEHPGAWRVALEALKT